MSLKELEEVFERRQQGKKTVIVTKEKLMEVTKERKQEAIKSLVSKYQKKHKTNFNMLLKLYLLQNYKLEGKHFPGFNLKTLSVYKSIMNRVMKNEEITTHHKYEEVIINFILELKGIIEPFPVLETNNGRVLPSIETLIKQNVLSLDEVKMVRDEIEGERPTRKMGKEGYSKVLEKLYEYLAKNPTKSIGTLMNKFPVLKKSTVNSLRGQFSSLARGKDEPWILDKVRRAYNSVHNPVIKKEEQVKKTSNSTTKQSDKTPTSKTCSNPIKERFALLSDNGVIMMPNRTEEYLRGFAAANNEFNENKLKLIQLAYIEV